MLAWALLYAVLWSLAGVKIYVKLHQASPVLICMDIDRANKETVDPTYLWTGPNENTLKGNSQINITNTGELVLKDFLEPLSGLYSCMLSYKTIKAETQEETMIKKKYDFLVFVNPFAPGWRSLCNRSADCEDITNHNVLKARDRMEEFFRKQAHILHHHFNRTVPAMHFVDHSFQVTRIDNCRPGFGKNEGLHSNCATCCVVCSPGTFSPDVDVTCQICVSVHIYGAKACP